MQIVALRYAKISLHQATPMYLAMQSTLAVPGHNRASSSDLVLVHLSGLLFSTKGSPINMAASVVRCRAILIRLQGPVSAERIGKILQGPFRQDAYDQQPSAGGHGVKLSLDLLASGQAWFPNLYSLDCGNDGNVGDELVSRDSTISDASTRKLGATVILIRIIMKTV